MCPTGNSLFLLTGNMEIHFHTTYNTYFAFHDVCFQRGIKQLFLQSYYPAPCELCQIYHGNIRYFVIDWVIGTWHFPWGHEVKANLWITFLLCVRTRILLQNVMYAYYIQNTWLGSQAISAAVMFLKIWLTAMSTQSWAIKMRLNMKTHATCLTLQ